jgi:RNA polymerase sigma-70 factor, ECF subfamily
MEDFERWYRREHPRVLATCVALTGDLDAAGDATDEAFSRALERWPVVGAMVSPGGACRWWR